MHLVGRLAPSPQDIIWANTYLSRNERIARDWIVFALVLIITVLWFIPVGALAVLLSPEGIAKISPSFADFLEEHRLIQALTTGFLPTLAYTVFFALVPFIFNYVTSLQGYVSSGHCEMAEISK